METKTSETCNLLTQPLSLDELLNEGSRFELNRNYEDDDNTNELFDELNLGSDDEDAAEQNNKHSDSPWTKSFTELRSLMSMVEPHMWKRIINEGEGVSAKHAATGNTRVTINYDAYWEHETEAFDSCSAQRNVFKFYFGQGLVLEGLEAAVRSMKCHEKAQFVIGYQLLFHEMGCPPRVKPKADALFVIELLRLETMDEAPALNAEQQREERRKFANVFEKAQKARNSGVEYFGQGIYGQAASDFEGAIHMLNYCRLQSDEEEQQVNALLLKLNVNLAVCYNKLKKWGKCCIVCKEIRYLTNDKPDAKALFQEARALMNLHEYERSHKLLMQAKSMEPQDAKIRNEFKQLYSMQRSDKHSERNRCAQALGMVQETVANIGQEIDAKHGKSFENEMRRNLCNFKISETEEVFNLPTDLTLMELSLVKKISEELGLFVRANEKDFIIVRTNETIA